MGDEQFRGSPNIQSSEPVVPASNTNTTPMAPAQESEAARRMAAMLAGGSEAAAIRPEMQNPYASVELGQDVALQSGQPYVAQSQTNPVEQSGAVNSEPKKSFKKIIVILLMVAVLAGGGAFAYYMLTKDNGPTVEPTVVENGDADDTPPVVEPTETVTQRIGTETHGYIDVPAGWTRKIENVSEDEFAYGSSEGDYYVVLSSIAAGETVTAESYASELLATAEANSESMPQMTMKKVGNLDVQEVNYYTKGDVNMWTFKNVFAGEDGRIHCISIVGKDNTNNVFTLIPDSWSLNQNKTE